MCGSNDGFKIHVFISKENFFIHILCCRVEKNLHSVNEKISINCIQKLSYSWFFEFCDVKSHSKKFPSRLTEKFLHRSHFKGTEWNLNYILIFNLHLSCLLTEMKKIHSSYLSCVPKVIIISWCSTYNFINGFIMKETPFKN